LTLVTFRRPVWPESGLKQYDVGIEQRLISVELDVLELVAWKVEANAKYALPCHLGSA
jgi:hypothetical protein